MVNDRGYLHDYHVIISYIEDVGIRENSFKSF